MSDWSPETYGRFRGLRLRPAIDLLLRVPDLPAGDVVDLGCGAGAAAEALAARFPGRRLLGLDASPAMLAEARALGVYTALEEADAALWRPASAPALIFSNALIQWLPDHASLLPRLAGLLVPGGTLAVQIPRQYAAPSHALLRQLAAEMFPDRFDFSAWESPVWPAADYMRLLAPVGMVSAWETDYVQRLAPAGAAHPVRLFTESTGMRPFLEKLSSDEAAGFVARYESALAVAYPPEEDGTVLFPFRRVFFLVTRPGGGVRRWPGKGALPPSPWRATPPGYFRQEEGRGQGALRGARRRWSISGAVPSQRPYIGGRLRALMVQRVGAAFRGRG